MLIFSNVLHFHSIYITHERWTFFKNLQTYANNLSDEYSREFILTFFPTHDALILTQSSEKG